MYTPLMREIPLQQARDQLGAIVSDVRQSHEPAVLTRSGKSEAVIVDFEEWQELEALRDAADMAIVRDRLAAGEVAISLQAALGSSATDAA